MTSKEIVLTAHRNQGHTDALALRSKVIAGEVTATQIVAQEASAPRWSPRNYLNTPVGSPYRHEGQVWQLIQPYDGTIHTAPPADLRAHWGVLHTTDPAKAKPFITPNTAAEVYMVGHCCTDRDSTYVCNQDNISHSPTEYPPAWDVWEA